MKRKKIKTFKIKRLLDDDILVESTVVLADADYICYSGFQKVTGIELKSGEIGRFKLVRVK